MADQVRIKSGGTGHVSNRPGKAEVNYKATSSEPPVDLSAKTWDVVTYGPPNRAVAELLMDNRLANIINDYTLMVMSNYRTMLEARSSTPPKLLGTLTASVNPYYGYRRDRWVGEVSVGSEQYPYGGADEFGRNAYAPYRGSADLENALRMVLRDRP